MTDLRLVNDEEKMNLGDMLKEIALPWKVPKRMVPREMWKTDKTKAIGLSAAYCLPSITIYSMIGLAGFLTYRLHEIADKF